MQITVKSADRRDNEELYNKMTINELQENYTRPYGSSRFQVRLIAYENTPIQIYRNFYPQKLLLLLFFFFFFFVFVFVFFFFQIKSCDIFHVSTQNINCGYSLEMIQK